MIYIDADIWRMKPEEVEACIDQLPSQRREVCKKYKFELGRRQALFSYLLLCRGLQEEYGIQEMPIFTFGEHGKPFLTHHPEIHFNISHCKEAVACAISDRPIGIDIEGIRTASDDLVRYVMNEREVLQITSSPCPNRTFSRIWTQKEALLKCSGQGICDDMKDVLVQLSDVEIETVETEGYIYSVCRPR